VVTKGARVVRPCALAAVGLAACLWAGVAPADTGMGAPIVIHSAPSARPGDIVGFQGENFGAEPSATLDDPAGGRPVLLERINTWGEIWASFRLPQSATGALVVRLGNGVAQSPPIALNAATPFHLDTLQLAASGAFRVFGRNLLQPGFVPRVTLDGLPATLDLAASNDNMLVARAPVLQARARVQVVVDNGNGTGGRLLDRPVSSLGGNGTDVFGLGVGWANAFGTIAAKSLNAHSEPRLPHAVKCDGRFDDTLGLQDAIHLANGLGGGVVVLPEGTCRLTASVQLKSNVVLQGAGKSRTVLAYEASYPMLGRNISLAGLRDLTLRNVAGPIESALMQNSNQVFYQNVAFEINGGVQMFLTGNSQFVIDGCDFIQPKNARGNGPFALLESSGLVFTHNRVVFAQGSPNFGRVHDSYIGDNHLSRDLRDNQNTQGTVHSLTLDFAHRVTVANNTLDVIGGPVRNKLRNDGETLLSEGGGANRTENIGYVRSAGASTLFDPDVVHKVWPFSKNEIPENYAVAIVGGRGQGQARRVMAYSQNTLTVDRAWDIVPDSSSRYATFVWGLEKSILRGNTLRQNPRGIWLYQTSVRDVDITANDITDGGGIYLRAGQKLKDKLFTPLYGVRVAGNTVHNQAGEWPAYIHLAFVREDEADFGLASIGVEIRDNTLQANQPNLSLSQEESGGVEGLVARTRFEGEAQGRSKDQMRLLGTIFQNNHCTACNVGVLVREGAVATVQDGNSNSAPDVPQ
jgi:hypothetical protein